MTVRDYFLPGSLPEALKLLERHGPELLVMAGGTIAMPLINDGLSLPSAVMSLRKVGLDRLECTEGVLRIGATATLTQLAHQDFVPILRAAARNTASWPVRNMGTVGGNLFTPPPGGDVAVALLALDATLVLANAHGHRTLRLVDFYTGFLTTALAPDELLVEIRVPCVSEGTAFVKFGRKHANTPAVVTVAARVAWLDARVSEARIALGAAGPHPVRVRSAESLLVGTTLDRRAIAAASTAAAEECRPFSDAIASDWYRRRMVRLFVGRTLERLAARAEGEVG
ncbi:MAG TPA: FAD binding domain-containing protein [Candidatus Limnocylindrales bacterium]